MSSRHIRGSDIAMVNLLYSCFAIDEKYIPQTAYIYTLRLLISLPFIKKIPML